MGDPSQYGRDAHNKQILLTPVMGTSPIQSCTSRANEWVTDGATGFIVSPEDPYAVAAAIRRAVSDDSVVDHAAEINAQVASERLNEEIIRPHVVEMYERIAAEGARRNR